MIFDDKMLFSTFFPLQSRIQEELKNIRIETEKNALSFVVMH